MFGAFQFFSNRPTSTDSTEAADLVSTDPIVSSAPSEPADLPSGDGMVEITAGTYEVGLDPADDYHSAPTNITLTNFWIDQYQITNSKYQQYIDATGSQTPEIWPGEGNHPVRGVTWDQAVAYCSWLNKRLPTEAEWEAAGRGPGARPQLYPWGNDATADGKINTIPDQDTYAVGSFSFNESIFGLFDMVGNVWEWVGEPYDSVPAGNQILRGGRYGNPQDLAYRLPVAPDDVRYVKYSGFRCATNQVR
jgi:formylglycine-generating enzyme required for sulfatase activity